MSLSNIGFLLTLLSLTGIATAHPQNAPRQADAPAGPFTTSVWTTTITSGVTGNAASGLFGRIEETTVATVTQIEIEATAITAYPTTITQTVISDMMIETRQYNLGAGGAPVHQQSWTALETHLNTWGIHEPAPTDLPSGTSRSSIPCGQCSGEPVADPVCASMGLETSCQGQCEERDGKFWCYEIGKKEYESELRMGRVCWGDQWTYVQLLTPCAAGDQAVGCTCAGEADNWTPVDWVPPLPPI